MNKGSWGKIRAFFDLQTEDFFIDIIEFSLYSAPFFFVPHAKIPLYLIPH